MSPRARAGFYASLVLSTGAALAAAGALLLVAMLLELLGPFRFCARDGAAGLPLRVQVAFWTPEGRLQARRWQAALEEGLRASAVARALEVRIRTLGSLGRLEPGAPHVLVAVAQTGLGEKELASVERFVRAGGAAVLVVAGSGGHAPSRSAVRLVSLLGAHEQALRPGGATLAAVLDRGPLVAGLAPGQRMVCQAHLGLAGPARPRETAELVRLDPARGLDAGGERLVLRRRLGAGKIVWLGCIGEASKRSRARYGRAWPSLLANAVAWAAGAPVAELLSWPDGASYAVAQEGAGAQTPHAAGPRAAHDSSGGTERRALEELSRELATLRLPPAGAQGSRAGASLRTQARLATARAGGLIVLPRSSSGPRFSPPRAGDAEPGRGAWSASLSEVAAWWRERARVRLGLVRRGPHGLRLDVTHRGREPVAGLVVRIHLNRAVARVRARATRVPVPWRARLLEPRGESLELELPGLRPGAVFSLSLDLLERRVSLESDAARPSSAARGSWLFTAVRSVATKARRSPPSVSSRAAYAGRSAWYVPIKARHASPRSSSRARRSGSRLRSGKRASSSRARASSSARSSSRSRGGRSRA